MGQKVKILKKNHLANSSLDDFHLICLTGEQKGNVYLLQGKRIVIGRSEQADIQIDDTKMSREHGELILVKSEWMITDLNSQNGIIVNNEKVKQTKLKNKDKVILGQTVLKFMPPQERVSDQVIKSSEQNHQGMKTFDHDAQKSLPKKKISPLVIIAIGLLLILVFFDFDDKKTPKSKSTVRPPIDMSYPVIQKAESFPQNDKTKEKLDAIFKRGLRELREKNYYRAINEFNLALVISPNNAQGDFYLRRAKEELDKEIEGLNLKAMRDVEALKYKSAIISYCAIIRLLYMVPNDKRYINADVQKKVLEKKLGIKEDEAFCLSK